MSSARNPFGLRLALWYAAVFTVSALAIVLLTYALTARSLAANTGTTDCPGKKSAGRRGVICRPRQFDHLGTASCS